MKEKRAKENNKNKLQQGLQAVGRGCAESKKNEKRTEGARWALLERFTRPREFGLKAGSTQLDMGRFGGQYK